MDVKQVYDFVNAATTEVLGASALVSEDLSNIVDVGTAIVNAHAMDNYVRALVNHIGRVICLARVYRGGAPSVLMDEWEFGSVLEKISAELPAARENESWNLVDQASYPTDVFYKPSVTAKFFNSRVTFEVPLSFTEKQVRESFSNAVQLGAFMSMLYTAVDKSMTIKLDALIMRTINNMIGETIHDDYGAATLSSKTGVKAINLLYLYNQRYSANLAAADAVTNPDFIRFAVYQIGLVMDRLPRVSTLYNVEGRDRFTPRDLMHIVMLADFRSAADVYLQSTTYNERFTALPAAEVVPYWQGSGTDYGFGSTSKIDVKTSSGASVEASGILCVIFDRDALGVCNMDRRVTSRYVESAEFYTNWYKMDAGYFNDLAENFVVFFAA